METAPSSSSSSSSSSWSCCSRGVVLHKAFALLQTQKIEEIVGGFILVVKAFDIMPCKKCSQLMKNGDIVKIVLSRLSPSVILKLLRSTNKKEIQASALSFICHSCLENRENINLWKGFVSEFVCVFLSSTTSEACQEEVTVLLKHLVHAVGSPMRDSVLHDLLQHKSTTQSIRPLAVLELLAELATSDPSTPILLCQHEGGVLMSLITQCLHGLAPAETRLRTLVALNNLLNASPESALLAEWTVVPSSIAGENRFPRMICSIVAGELKLVCDASLSVLLDNSNHIANQEGSNNLLQSLQLLVAGCNLVQSFLRLLVGSDDASDNDASGEPIWSTLSYEAILAIKQSLQSCHAELLDFVVQSSSVLQKESECDASAERMYFLTAYRSSLVTLIALSREDEELREALVTKLRGPVALVEVMDPSLRKCLMEYLCALASQYFEDHRNDEKVKTGELLWKEDAVLDSLVEMIAGLAGKLPGMFSSDSIEDSLAQLYTIEFFCCLFAIVDEPLKVLLRAEGERAMKEMLHCSADEVRALYDRLRDMEGLATRKEDPSAETYDIELKTLSKIKQLVERIEDWTALQVL
eukprot:gene3647-3993_t